MISDEKSQANNIENVDEPASCDLHSFIEEDESENISSLEPKAIRDKFKEYFNSVGAVPWQNDTIRL